MSTAAPRDPRCAPRFPAAGALLDNCVLVRFWKCDALDALANSVPLFAASHVVKEFQRQGREERAALARLGVEPLSVRLGTREWELFGELRGGRLGTRDLGEDESIAIALAHAERGQWLPFVTYDGGAAKQCMPRGVATLDFLDTLSWLTGCGVIEAERADEIEALAQRCDGWKRPIGYAGSIAAVRDKRQATSIARVGAWRSPRGSDG